MTENVTIGLPEPWQGEFTQDRAVEWILERDEEGPTLLIVSRSSGLALGFMILHVIDEGRCCARLRIGYMLEEASWGRGLGSEVISGLVHWARASGVKSIIGGVAADNYASQRVLEKNGFVVIDSLGNEASDELLFEWSR